MRNSKFVDTFAITYTHMIFIRTSTFKLEEKPIPITTALECLS